MKRVLVTGATGFIGRAVCDDAMARGWRVRAALRSRDVRLASPVEQRQIGDISDANWASCLEDTQAVIHLAGIAHEIKGQQAEAVYHRVNSAASERLAREAARHGVRRFVFVSSIKVNGERTAPGQAFRSSDVPAPRDRYGESKWHAERALARVAAETGIEVTVVRPPLVYGPGVRANFLRLIRLVDSGLPLPFASIHNRRSLVYVGNLSDLLLACASAPQAAGRTLLAADARDLSTPQLVAMIATALGRRPRLLPFPPALLRAVAAACGQADKVGRLVESLVVDAAETRDLLDWQPRCDVTQALAQTIAWYRTRRAT